MAIKPSKAEKKVQYDKRLCRLLDEYSQVLIVAAENVGSNQLLNIRKGLCSWVRTLIRRCIKLHAENTGNRNLLNLLPILVVSEEVAKYRVGAPARVGLVAPIDVVVPPGNTGLDPSQTSFFQVLNIPTKINKERGRKYLAKLGISPFSYGLVVLSVYSPQVLDLTEDDLTEKFAVGVGMITAFSLAISYPTLAAAPHMFINGYKNVIADPSKFAVAAAPVAAAPAAEESDEDMGFSLFD
ncbi:Ribosomal protein L10P protein [Dioscorea alata]|uniref:Ribosomal protein L10P protein n=1 Tax=Dioscorea alata TaxID=55571 RepID=A0ACB7VGK1_DIOAL|nr:Ribosomal protein L10P protein [Dioscorea alata]